LRDPITAALMHRLAALSADSMEGRLAGSPGGRRARGWIERELQAIGVAAIGPSYEQPVRLRSRSSSDTLGANVVARIPGRNPGLPVIVLSAHYDHLGVRGGQVYNGADDDASGCVALLAIAERLKKAPIDHDVVLAFFDGEESGLTGARAFVRAPSVPLDRIAIDINLDMVSRQDGGALWVAGTSHYPFLRPTVERVAKGAAVAVRLGHDTKSLKPDDDWTESSDHGAFHDNGIPFLYLGVEDHADYHRPGDDAEKVLPSFFRGVVDFADALVRAVDATMATFPSR
jgi:Zn-dependent M28 family amino/carboxypeptidase